MHVCTGTVLYSPRLYGIPVANKKLPTVPYRNICPVIHVILYVIYLLLWHE
jgi:hypothetical protein